MKISDAPIHPKDINKVILGEHPISISEFVAVARYGAKVSFSQSYCDRVKQSRHLIEKFLNENRIIYGVTTGFGSNVTEIISTEDAETLQRNIVRSHAVSVGEPLEKEVVRAIQLMILIHLGHGYSGVRLELLELVASLLNQGITPFAPGDGSVGYLSPEAHMALVLIGEGKAWYNEELISGSEALERAGLKPTTFSCKEGLALTSGTSSVTAMAILTLYNAIQAAKTADIAGAMSLEALKGTIHAFDPRLHSLKKHEEQAKTAQNIIRILKGSEIAETYKNYRLQDALSLRCIPQVHGASKKNLKDAAFTINNELNSVSDNPVIYPDDNDGIALMGGNFDGTYVGIQADIMCIAMANLAKIAERRIDRLVNYHLSELPSFLVKNPGLNSGYMIPQYTAVGLLGEIRILSHPASVDNVPTCANQEDVVSFAYVASRKAYQISKKLTYILAIELMTAVQALDFHRPLNPSPVIAEVYNLIRSKVPTVEEDRFLYPDIVTIYLQIHEGDIVKVVEDMIGEIE
ncbi:histidine ammonia-lyase [Paenibacillus sp. V4I3]|uniref:histidine ammonia-lyase n=1 Tax=unclassified Paenibacillus TaxID=185978 RepID=UPI0027801790|nr:MULTISPECIES: histidine ammonia-lyase [unclassified Paenibacillus]MDQ0874651.1 histidine ammonia-lyase [Paenibacillus sp. V4I3]MDQ0889597.1 histidine ammonia-lyase [Paenibacillus sp. V4I9]